jgi:undecaprenyl-diphosphatase
MTEFEAFILGVVQGITEFLPISSSAHLKLVKFFFQIEPNEGQVYFDLVCHLGTLIALLGYLKTDLINLFITERKKLVLLIVALIPLIPCYLLLKPLRDFLSQLHFLGGGLCFTGILLFISTKWSFKPKTGYRDAWCIGIMQSMALIPGISRSGSTLATARILGWNSKEAVRFSFLLAIPTVIGGNTLELIKLSVLHVPIPSFTSCLIGFLSSLGLGAVVVRYALPLLERGHFKPFAWYCLSVGLLTTIYMTIYG